MKLKTIICVFMMLAFAGVKAQTDVKKETFSKEALKEKVVGLNNEEISFKDVLKKYKGKVVVIDFWASWCSDCIKGMPEVKKLQAQYKDGNTVFLFLSLDKAVDSWKKGIERFDVVGEHYYIQAGWKGSKLCEDVKLDWIPRYMIVDKTGKIAYYKAIKANDEQLINNLKSLQ
ncbi:TlpA family protein disulfide reductase [Neptunitalea lumnitzerae]|nr:TlpA disulfide reductase family protein [Neptunitalea sp. Y10]